MQDYTKVTNRIWHLICYDEKVLKAITDSATRYAYILHDKDVFEDGTSKPPHWHVYCYRRNDTKGEFFVKLGRKISPDNGTVRVAVQTNGAEAIDYFQHLHDGEPIEGKTQYPLSDVVFDAKGNDDHFKSKQERDAMRAETEQKKQDDNVAFINDLLVYRFNPFELAKRYGRGYICNRRSFDEFASNLIDDENTPLDELSEEARSAVLSYRKTVELPSPDPDFGFVLLGLQSAEESYKHAVMNNLPSDVRVQAYNTVMTLRKQVSAFEIGLIKGPQFGNSWLITYRQQCIDAYLHDATPLNPADFE